MYSALKKSCQSFVLLCLLGTTNLGAQTITTIAGGGGGDGHLATQVGMSPFGVCTDGTGNVYIADMNNNRVLKVDAAGIVTTVAGTGIQGYNGDGIAASTARLNAPAGVTTDAAGNIYIADKGNGLVRKVNTSGIISTFAGGGIVLGDGGPATDAAISSPRALAIDPSGHLYIADNIASRIRKVSTTGIITTFAGNGTSGFGGDGGPAAAAMLQSPTGIAIDATGNVFIADIAGKRIRKVATTGIISTYAGTGTTAMAGDGGPATAADLYNPGSVAVDNAGNVYSADQTYGYVRKINIAGVINTITGGGGLITEGVAASSAALYATAGIAFDATGNLYVVDQGQYRVRKINTSNIINTIAGNRYPTYLGDGSAAGAAGLQYPSDIATDGTGNIYIADQNNNRIRKISTTGIISTIAGTDTAGYGGDGGPATMANLHVPLGVTVDGTGNVYFSDHSNHRIRKVSTTGIITTVAGSATPGFSGDGGPATAAQIAFPYQLTFDRNGNLYFADEGNNRIRKITTGGIISTVAGSGSTSGFAGDGAAATAARLSFPTGVAVDTSGNIYIADMVNNRIRKVNTSGIISTIAGGSLSGYSGDGFPAVSAELYEPTGVKLDSAGNLYIADLGNSRIRMINNTGIISLVAGSAAGYGGDGGPATAAYLNHPAAIAFNGCNGLYIADADNNVIRLVNFTAPIIGTSNVCAGAAITLTDSTTGGIWSSSSTTAGTVGSSTGIVYGVAAGSTVISYTTINTCGHAVATAAITVNPLPQPGAITGSSVFCTGSTTPLADTSSTGVWSSSATSIATVSTSGIVTGVAPGTAVISYTVTNSCGTASALDTITVGTAPSAGSITGTSTIDSATMTTLTATVAGGTWTSSNNAVATVSSSGVVTGVSSGTAVISYTVTNSCGTAIATFVITIVHPTGIYAPGASAEVMVYPNPARDYVTITAPYNMCNDWQVIISDISGRVVGRKYCNTPVATIDLTVTPGIYFVKLINNADGSGIVKKLVVKGR